GLSTNMARGMGEGWSDFYAHSMLSEPTDPANGIYSLGGYATYLVSAGFAGNYYYGIRRYPKAPLQFTGGANNKPHNAYTFSYINSDCNSRMNNTNFAFGRGPIGSSTCDQVHNIGEIWSSILWEVRHKMITRLGWADGNRKTLQYVTDGMKLAPIGPTLLTERDAILAAVQASGTAGDLADFWAGFAARGLGFNAQLISASPANVVDGFNLPNAFITDPFSVSDSTGDNDGFPEPGENIQMSVAVTNTTGQTVTNVTVTVTGGVTVNYGTINSGQTVTQNIPYTVPGNAVCGSMHQVEMTVNTNVGANSPTTREFRLGAPVGGAPLSFQNTTTINVPQGQPTTTTGAGGPYPSTISVAGVSGQRIIKVELTNVSHTWVDDVDVLLEGPGGQKFMMMSDVFGDTDPVATTLTFTDAADSTAPDGGPLAPGEYKPTNVDTTSDAMPAPAPAAPYQNPAPAGSATFASTFGTDGGTMNGDWKLWVRDDASGDVGTIQGWKIIFESDAYECSLTPSSGNGRADFDGDGKTDISVFRGSEG
ncbi:MAG TPA: M36 family metallopeptidase, partial [Pyrinomonadaceae bacterium]|nr:M36 family metallopeptidase [Pyrinomonadaceae bacterium]